MRLPGIGGRRYAVGASVAVSIGSAWTAWCARWIPSVRISHPYPSVRFDAIQDRKSTRLNSSHLGISYAVFCLKKKKHQIYDTELANRASSGCADSRRIVCY